MGQRGQAAEGGGSRGPRGSCVGIPHKESGTMPRFLACASSSEKEQVRTTVSDKKFKVRLICLKMNLETKECYGLRTLTLSN